VKPLLLETESKEEDVDALASDKRMILLILKNI